VELLVLDLDLILVAGGTLPRQVILPIYVLNGLGVHVVQIDVLLLLGLLVLFLLQQEILLAFDVEWVDAFEFQLKEADQLELVRLPQGRMLVLELGEDVRVTRLQQVVGQRVRDGVVAAVLD